jgi:fermentation-respiration switch protein FrsA (DUF1100 family)
MIKRLIFLIILLVGAVFLLNRFVVPRYEPFFIYFPTEEIAETPRSVGLNYEDVYITTDDKLEIHGWFVKNPNTNKVILFFHGNGGNIGDRLPLIKLLYKLPASVFIIDYHGYGQSEGAPSEENLYMDALAAYKYLVNVKKYRPSQIIAMGSSLGGAVAAYLAENQKVVGLVLQKTFTTAPEMAKEMNFFYQPPLVWVESDFDTLSRMSKIHAPKLIVHSREDEVIPFTMSVALYKKAIAPVKLLLVETGGHNDLIETKEYIDALRQILRSSDL